MNKLILVLLLSLSLPAASQTAGNAVDYPYLGIKFTMPAGWKGAEDGDYFLMGSDTEPGLMAITLNAATEISQLKQVADEGIIDEGVMLSRSGDFEKIGAEGLGAEFSGNFQGQNAKAFVAGVINPYGKSVTLIAITTADLYSSDHVNRIKELANSLQFAVPAEAPHNKEWEAGLVGRKLTAMHSSSSTGSDYYDASGNVYGSYSSYSSRTTIHLCSNRRFYYSSSSSASFDSVGGFGSTGSRGSNEGSWKVGSSAAGDSLLWLTYDNTNVVQYRLDFKDSKTLLNGSRYFRTASDACD